MNPIKWIRDWWASGKARDRFANTANTEARLLVQIHKDYLAAVQQQGKESLRTTVLRAQAKRALDCSPSIVANALVAIPDRWTTEEDYEIYESYSVVAQNLAEELDE